MYLEQFVSGYVWHNSIQNYSVKMYDVDITKRQRYKIILAYLKSLLKMRIVKLIETTTGII